MLAVLFSDQKSNSLSIQYQRFTPSGFIQVVDNSSVVPTGRYLRVDSSILGFVELAENGTMETSKTVSSTLFEKLALRERDEKKRALVMYVSSIFCVIKVLGL